MSMLWFWIFAGLMLAIALVLLLRPLLGGGTDREMARKLAALHQAFAAGVLNDAEYADKLKTLAAQSDSAATPRGPLWLVLGLSLVVPLFAVAAYLYIGNPGAIVAPSATPAASAVAAAATHTEADGTSGPEMDKAVSGLAEKLKQNPDDLEGWLLLGRAYKTMQRFADARDALEHAYKLSPENRDVMVDYAEALALSGPDHRIEGQSRALIDQALKADPKNQRALWLLGIAQAQAEHYPQAIAAWETLLPMLEADSDIAKSVRAQIAEARKRGGMAMPTESASTASAAPKAPPASDTAPLASTPAAPGAKLVIKVDLAPELKARVAATDVLYVFARSATGPKMPLAIQKLTASQLPLTVTLTDGMGMMPTMQLSSAEQVIVGARISKSGVANPSSGDLQVLSAPITTKTQTATIVLTINEVVP